MTAAAPDWKDSLRDLAPENAFPVQTILIPLDGTEVANVAMPVARSLAEILAATLHVLYVGPRVPSASDILEQLGLSAEEMHGAVLDQLTGEPAAEIMNLAYRVPAPLIVVATHTGRHRFGASVGSITRALLAQRPGAIVLVPSGRRPEPWRLRRVLMAHAGTPSCDSAIAPAAELAHRAGAEVTALHIAARTSRRPTEPGSLLAPLYVDQPQHEWPAWANEFVERMLALGHHPGVINFKLLVAGGQPGSEVAHMARESGADLVVVPWQGKWESQRPGAVKAIVANSGCPVLLICRQTDRPEPVPEG